MRLLIQKNGELSSYFDKIDETETSITKSLLKRRLFDSHTKDVNKVKGRAQVPLEHLFGYCKTLIIITEDLGFELHLKTSHEKQIIFHTTLGGNDVRVKINSLYLYIASLVRSAEQQKIFNESIRSTFTLSFD